MENKFCRFRLLVVIIVFFVSGITFSQQDFDPDTVKSSIFDMGKMWTFDNPPVDYFEKEYGFKPSQEWLNSVRMSALRFSTFCSASFVSEDGLVMTNHHCGRGAVDQVQKENENLHRDGFIAVKLENERVVSGLFVDQLVQIIDVTKEIQNTIDEGKTNEEKIILRNKKISELEKRYAEELKLKCQVVTLYNGGEYSLYAYKRYNDVRLVFAPEENAGFFGGDPDNFTYPRYNLDCTFFRVYDENGKPLKTSHFFKWSPDGAKPGEQIFVVGNPGRTDRLKTVAQLEFDRDITLPENLRSINKAINDILYSIKEDPSKKDAFSNTLFGLQNSQKVYLGEISALQDKVLIARKKDFEKTLREKIELNPVLKEKYDNIFDNIYEAVNGRKKIYGEIIACRTAIFSKTLYFYLARRLFEAAETGEKITDEEINSLFSEIPDKVTFEYEINSIMETLSADSEFYMSIFGGKKGKYAADYLLDNSKIVKRDDFIKLNSGDLKNIYELDDPFIKLYSKGRNLYGKLNREDDDYNQTIAVNMQLLGRAIFDVYGHSIPPDATFTLRISDGVVKSYPYNGTIAPPKTTFFGYYDRYYSFDKEFPWVLPDRWLNPPKEFKLETPVNFISTNDIIGGNSGSPVINKNAEIVGLAFDGNIESLPGRYIFTTEKNRTVSVASEGLLEAVKNLYKFSRLAEELQNGKIK